MAVDARVALAGAFGIAAAHQHNVGRVDHAADARLQLLACRRPRIARDLLPEHLDKPLADCLEDLNVTDVVDWTLQLVLQILVLERVEPEREGLGVWPPVLDLNREVLRSACLTLGRYLVMLAAHQNKGDV